MKITLVEANSLGIHSLTHLFIHSFTQYSLSWSYTVLGYLTSQNMEINELAAGRTESVSNKSSI